MNKLNCKVKLSTEQVVEINCFNMEFKRKIANLEPTIPFDNLLILDYKNRPFSVGKNYSSNITFNVQDLAEILNQFNKLKMLVNQFEQNKKQMEVEFSSEFRKNKDIDSELQQLKLNYDSLKNENENLKQKLQIMNQKFKEKTQEQIQHWEKQQERQQIESENLIQIQQLLTLDKEQLEKKLKENFKKQLGMHFVIVQQEKRILILVSDLSTTEEKLCKKTAELEETKLQLQEEKKKNSECQVEMRNWQSTVFKLVFQNKESSD